jgi:acyl carrier protein
MNQEDFIQFTAKELMTDPQKLRLESRFRDLPRWSSLNALIYISRIREEFKVTISSRQLAESVTLGDIYQLVCIG